MLRVGPEWLKAIVFPVLTVVIDLGETWEPVNEDICSPKWWGGVRGRGLAALVISFPRQGRSGVARGCHEEAKGVANTREGRAETQSKQFQSNTA